MSEITIYWADLNGRSEIKKPEKVFDFFLENRLISDFKYNIFVCPASNNFYKNLFVFRSNFYDLALWPEGYLKSIYSRDFSAEKEVILESFGNSKQFSNCRPPAMKDYVDLTYNVGWLLFASEPLEAKITAPFAPSFSPIDGAIFTNGGYDIGQWFRPGMMQFIVPTKAKKFCIRKNDPLFYLEINTDKKIKFQKFKVTEEIMSLYSNFTKSPITHGKHLALSERYEILQKQGFTKKVIEEIEKNLI